MLRTLTILNSSQQVVRSADKFEAKHGARGRLLVLIIYPAQLLATYAFMRLFGAISAPLRRALGHPAPPTEMRIAAAWLRLLAANGSKPSAGSLGGGGIVLSSLDGLPIANVLGVGAKVQMARVEALSDLELTAVLAHELGHMRLRHVFIFSLALAALAAGLPWLVRKLALPESPADRRKRERDEAWDKDPYKSVDASWAAAAKAVIDATPREFAVTGVSVVGVALAISAVQRFLERQADDYAAALVGAEPLIGAISAFDAADTQRNSQPGRRAAFWRADASFARGPLGRLFAAAPSGESRIKRLRAKS
jgi:hypothetical protein